MKVIVNKTNRVAFYIFNDNETIDLSDKMLIVDNVRVLDINNTTHEVAYCKTPKLFISGAMILADNGELVVSDTFVFLEENKKNAIDRINSIDEKAPIEINGITFNGGDSSASAISGAVTLAQNLGESEVKLWDVNNIVRSFTFEEALNIAAQIAKAYRDTQFAKYEKIEALKACTTLAEVEALS